MVVKYRQLIQSYNFLYFNTTVWINDINNEDDNYS